MHQEYHIKIKLMSIERFTLGRQNKIIANSPCVVSIFKTFEDCLNGTCDLAKDTDCSIAKHFYSWKFYLNGMWLNFSLSVWK